MQQIQRSIDSVAVFRLCQRSLPPGHLNLKKVGLSYAGHISHVCLAVLVLASNIDLKIDDLAVAP